MSHNADPLCDKEFDPALCCMRHAAAKYRLNKGLQERIGCATCPTILEWMEENKVMSKKIKECCVCGEKRPIIGRGMCSKHYQQFLKTRKINPENKKPEPPTQEVKLATVESETNKISSQSASYNGPIVGVDQLETSAQIISLQAENTALRQEIHQLKVWVDRLTKAVAA